ncbi:DUF881 domain-containing protein [Heyndrickxia sporothermodurans]|uniref:DUF881 domain-containing protein n=1 Tax=Heyndrickxia sporothermodurans TaxID=46224 RepID=A0A150L760_9BACI|nr:DUF881 domain-containing protein [Heyndrickxia sporothermodurans]KYD08153.1 hypothetical protein B4102_1235 [Heyndrickxia sporothermodurans]MBL5767866.1 DUF881 domain-containing protein [Heyndrickxia sporothermodurans]MBL5771449.1 DUF881 domain-containing protein [Heyndrickxia sporothermodurans]MBL5775125.1 DUF881 domain-containing protein [Heyndrickxia sporothermodurans]MBL5778554.1 DUF881 domain-containing protein [Heyndrickxia sporothermodurans]
MASRKSKGKSVILALVCIVLGFMLAFSYKLANKEQSSSEKLTDPQFARETELRKQLIRLKQDNRSLQKELEKKQSTVRTMEKDLSKEEQVFFNLAEDAEKYRMYLGKVKVAGKGIDVTLEDGAYDPKKENVNSYIVHDHHVFKVINELYVSGAQAIAINGQRINHNSYIICNGPVITVDGVPFPEPFKISAIGDPDVLASALSITGGIKDQLVNDNIIFTVEKKDQIQIGPIFGES